MEKLIWLYTILVHLLILQYVIVAFSFSVHHLCHHDEGLALLQFKEELFNINASNEVSYYFCDGYYPKLTSWNKSRDCCTWDGVTCHEITGHVISLDLSCSHIEGVISPNSTLFGLSHLQKLNLALNDFKHSQISGRFGGLTQLTHLNLYFSNFSGQIASEISHLSKLVLLDLSFNQGIRFEQHDFQMFFQNLTEISVINLYDVDIPSKVPMNLSSSLTYLDLSYTGIHGKLPNHVFELPNMRALIFRDNENLSGTLPKFNSSISSMEVLDLRYTKFSGELPDSIGCLKSLSILYLDSCQFSGFVPQSIGNLSKLIELNLAFNNFIGQIPASIFTSLQKLNYISLSSNNLVGSIPKSISTLVILSWLDLSFNNFGGIIDSNLFSNMKKLVHLDLSFNNFGGIIDSNLLSNMKKLVHLDLSYNKWLVLGNDANISLHNLGYLGLSSCGLHQFPNFIQNSKTLASLELSNNNIRHIPNWLTFMALDSLTYLNLSGNTFSTPFILPWKSITILDLRLNQLQGPLPISICNLKALEILDVSDNKFSSEIPECFGNFSKRLSVLNLNKNNLQGSIGMIFATNNSLRYLGLQGNFLEGPLPPSLVNCEQLEVLDIGNNKINDTFPTWVENLKELQVLVLKSNRFFGPISVDFKNKNPFRKLIIMDLSNNEFTGAIPVRLLTSLRAMMNQDRNESKAIYMEANSNIYSGNNSMTTDRYRYSISISMKGLSMELTQILSTLTTIDLSNNKFIGEIHQVIGNLVALEVLNLSHNRFSGNIPSTFGKLSSLESLDISCNQIEGEIPSQLASLTSLEVLDVSQNHLVGRIPLGNQFNTFSNDSYKGNLGLCGLPLTKKCGETKVPPPIQEQQQEEDSGFFSGFTWKPVIVGYGFGFVLALAFGSLMFATRKPQGVVRFIEEEIYQWGMLLVRRKQVYKRFGRSNRRAQKHRRSTHWRSNQHE